MIWNTNLRWRLPVACLLLEVALIALFGVFVRYDMDADPHWVQEKVIKNLSTDLENEFYYRYPSKFRHLAGHPTTTTSPPRPGRRVLPGLGRELPEEMQPPAPCPAPLRLPTMETSQCLEVKLGKWPGVPKFLGDLQPLFREPFLMSSGDPSQWVTLALLSSCAQTLHLKRVVPTSRAAGVAHWPTSPAGVEDHSTTMFWLGEGEKCP